MNYTELQDAISRFSVEDNLNERKPLYALRNEFVKNFSRAKIERMTIDDYVEGKSRKDTFCYIIERDLDKLGTILGSFDSPKFGVYFKKEDRQYHFLPKYGNSPKEAFGAIREAILTLLEDGENEDLEALENNILSPMFKGKILSVYYPDRYLNIFSDEHLIHYVNVFNLDTETLIKQDPIYKREALLAFKNSVPEMKGWSPDIFGKFLYMNFPPKMKTITIRGKKRKVCDIEFPTPEGYSYVDNISIDPTDSPFPTKNKGIAPKVNYESESRKYRKYGDRGEKIVMMAEIDRVMAVLHMSEKVASKKVIQMSAKSDSYGYDILSLNPDGSNRYIEVKATSGKVGDVAFYYTENELEKANEYGKDYYIYLVFEIKSKKPKIWVIQNPFLDGEIKMKPVQYKVSIHTK